MLKQFFLSPSVSDKKYQTLAMLRNSNNTPYLHKYEGFSIIQHPRRRHLYFCVRIRVLGFFFKYYAFSRISIFVSHLRHRQPTPLSPSPFRNRKEYKFIPKWNARTWPLRRGC